MATDAAVQFGVFSIPLSDGENGRRSLRLGDAPTPLRQYIAGPENATLPVVVDAVFARNGRFNPLTLVAPSGMGKTHLVTGLVERLKDMQARTATVLQLHAESKSASAPSVSGLMAGADFARQVTDAIQTDSLSEFRESLKRLSLFVLDNLEEIASKPHAQREFCDLLDAFQSSRTQVIVTSRTSPLESIELTQALSSRLAGGLVLAIERPSEATRRVLIGSLAVRRGQPLAEYELDRLTEFSANQTPLQIQSLLINYSNYLAISETHGSETVLDAFIEGREQPSDKPTLKQIAAQTARLFQVTQRELCGPTRRHAVVRARGVAMFVARKLNGDSLEAIGRHFGNRDHTTVMHACKRTESLIEEDPFISESVEKLLMHWEH